MNPRLLCLILLTLANSAQAFREEDSPFDVDYSKPPVAEKKPVTPEAPKPVLKEKEPDTKPIVAKEKEKEADIKPAAKPAPTDKTTNKKPKVATEGKPAPKITDKTTKPAAKPNDKTVKPKPIATNTPPKEPAKKDTAKTPAATVSTPAEPTPPELTSEQRLQQALVASAEKIDHLNKELLTQNQSLQLYNDKLTQQVELLKRDRSGEAMRNGALAVIVGLFLGWFFASSKRRPSKW